MPYRFFFGGKMSKSKYLICAMMAVIGLLMIIAAEPIVQVLVIIIGLYALLNGIFELITLLSLVDDKKFKIEIIIRSSISIIIGLLCIILPITIAQLAWQVMIYIIAIYGIISAILEIVAITHIKKAGLDIKKYAIEVVSTVVVSIVLFLLPSSFGFTLIKIGGIILILSAAAIAFYTWKNRDIIQNPEDIETTTEEK